ncbi:MAG: hypothetical protein KGD67_08450 [Candidatus Lokiarchaeota archaeon]|nr:hypothetical protein [Candidatus Lokiarchaeota archaeon]
MTCSKCGENNVYINNRHIICRNCGHRKYLRNLYIHEREYKKYLILWKLKNRGGVRYDNEIYCQYCGMKLTKDEQLTHSCK